VCAKTYCDPERGRTTLGEVNEYCCPLLNIPKPFLGKKNFKGHIYGVGNIWTKFTAGNPYYL